MPEPTPPFKSVGDFIRTQRELMSLSMRQLAGLAKVSNPYLSQIERGVYTPSAQVLKGIADALDMSAETLYREAGLLDDSLERPDLDCRGRHPSGRSAHPGSQAGVDPGLPRLDRHPAAVSGSRDTVAPASQDGRQSGAVQSGAGQSEAEVPLRIVGQELFAAAPVRARSGRRAEDRALKGRASSPLA